MHSKTPAEINKSYVWLFLLLFSSEAGDKSAVEISIVKFFKLIFENLILRLQRMFMPFARELPKML